MRIFLRWNVLESPLNCARKAAEMSPVGPLLLHAAEKDAWRKG